MAKTLSEAFHEVVTEVRRLNVEADSIVAELGANSFISQQKLRRLLTLNADTYDTILANQTLTGLGQYASDQLGGINIGAVAASTRTAMTTYRDYMIANLPMPSDNGLDTNGRSTNLQVTTTDMPDLVTQINSLIAATEWA